MLVVCLPQYAHGSQYAVQPDGNNFNVTWQINAWQNITSFPSTLVYPENLNYSLSGGDLQAMTSALRSAIQAKVSTAQITQTTARITSTNSTGTSCSPVCARQWLNLSITFQVQETPSITDGVASYDLSWKAIRLNDDLAAAGVSYNLIGSKYLVSALGPIITSPIGTGRSITVAIGTTGVTRNSYQAVAANVVLLDMSPIDTPLANWIYTRNIITQTQTWTSPQNGGFRVSVDLGISEPGSTTAFIYSADAEVSGQLTAPLSTYARGDSLYRDTSNGFVEKVAFSIILGSLGVLIGTIVLDRKITSRSSDWRRTRKNRKT